MRLVEIDVQMLPGIQPGFRLTELAAGANLVTGPNAVGKSSLVRALSFLIGGVRTGDPQALSLSAVFEAGDGGRWTVRRTGTAIAWENDGRAATPPPLPTADQLYCYWLSMEDLLHDDARDEVLLAELRRALSGGYDLESLQNSPAFTVGARHGQNQASRLIAARRTVREVETGYEALRREEEGLPSLEEEAGKAEAAAESAERLERALSVLEARRKRLDVEAGLREFPGRLAKFHGDEFERLCALEARRGKLDDDRKSKVDAAAAARGRLERTGLAGGRPLHQDLNARLKDIGEARRRMERREIEQRALDEASVVEQQALANLGAKTDEPKLDPESLSAAEEIAGRLQRAERERAEIAARIAGAPDAPDAQEVERSREAADALRAWLSAERSAPQGLRLAAGIAAACGLVAAAIALAVQVWIVAVFAAAAAAAAGWLVLRLGDGRTDDHRERFQQTGEEPPAGWSRERVGERLRELDDRLAEFRDREAAARAAGTLRKQLTGLEEKVRDAEAAKNRMAEKLGFDPSIAASGLDRLVRLLAGYEEAKAKRFAAARTIERLDSEIGERLKRVSGFLEEWNGAKFDSEGIEGIEAALDSLHDRCREAEAAEREASDADRERVQIEKSIGECEAETRALFEKVELDPNDGDELRRCCDIFESWKAKKSEADEWKTREAERRRPLENDEPLIRRIEADDKPGLEGELVAAKEAAGRLKDLRDRIAGIRTRLEQAGRDGSLAKALAGEEEARAALEDEYERALFAGTAQFLIGEVQREYRSEHEPEVLKDARRRFLTFTHHGFSLEVDSSRGFSAIDCARGDRRALSELSSGTRMQLLLAVRIAWTRQIERGREPLPLFLDEALTTSDERRFAQVVESLETLSREEGRQVFYLSARRHEILLWENAAGRRPHVIDLAAVRFGGEIRAPEDYKLPDVEPLPRPDGMTPEQFAAALRVPPVDPRQPAGSIHIFHILRDNLFLLHRLLDDWRVSSVGQLEALLESEAGASAAGDEETRRTLAARCAIVRSWTSSWREGRGKPVDRIALERSGAVSGKFIDAVSELAAACGGDGTTLIAGLRNNEVPRFRGDKAESLEEWLRAEGYIDGAEVLDADSRCRRVLTEIAGRVEPGEIRTIVKWLDRTSA